MLLTSCRPKSSNSNMYPSKTNDDSSRKSEQRSANLINNALSVATPSGTISHDTHTIEISELKMSIKQLTEAHKHQQSTTEGTCNAILEHMLSSKEELLVLHNDVKQLLPKRGGESSQPLDMLNETLRALTNEMKSSNDEHREAILTLKVWSVLVSDKSISCLPSHLIEQLWFCLPLSLAVGRERAESITSAT
jgi:hypothetical protein